MTAHSYDRKCLPVSLFIFISFVIGYTWIAQSRAWGATGSGAQVESGRRESLAQEPNAGLTAPAPLFVEGEGKAASDLSVLAPPVPTKSVAALIEELVEEIAEKAGMAPPKSAEATAPEPDAPAIATPPATATLPPVDAGKAVTTPEPTLPPLDIQKILESIPPSGPARTEIRREIEAVTQNVRAGETGSREDAVNLIQQLHEYTFDPLTISGSRLPSSRNRLSRIPANTTLITQDQLSAQGPKSVYDALSLIEGAVLYDQVGNGFDQTFGLRGFETGSEVAIIVDGVRYNEPAGGVFNLSLINVDDVAEIEVSRGSYSGVYGNSAFGGVVNITTRQAVEEKVKPFGSIEFGTHERYFFSGGASGTVPDTITGMDGKMKYVFSVSRKMSEFFRVNSEIRQTNFITKWGYVWPDDMAGANFQLTFADNSMSNPGALTIPQFHNDPSTTAKPLDGRKMENLVIQADAYARLHEKVTVRANAYRRIEDIDFTTTSITSIPNSVRNLTQFMTTKAFTAMVEYQEGFSFLPVDFLRNTFQVGVDVRNENENDMLQGMNSQGQLDGSSTFGGGAQGIDSDNVGVFIQNVTELFERFIATVGLRRDFVDYRFDQVGTAGVVTSSFNNTAGHMGAVLKLHDRVDLYANYSEGFKAPSTDELFSFSFLGGNPTLGPEESNSYEVGLRLRELGPVAGNLSFFYIDVEGEILFDPTAGPIGFGGLPTGQNLNVGNSRRYGVELSLRVKLREWLESFFTYTYTKANLRSTLPFPSGSLFSEAGAFQSGTDIGLVPRNRFTFGLTAKPTKKVRVHLNAVYTGAQRSQGYEALGALAAPLGPVVPARVADSPIDGYMVVNGKVSVTVRDIELFLQMTNIFDTNYISRSVTAFDFSQPTGTQHTTFVTPGQGRELSFGTRLNFG